jgi:aspartate aminotransferase
MPQVDRSWLSLPGSPTRRLDRILEGLKGVDVVNLAAGRPGLPPPSWLLEWYAERLRSGSLQVFGYTPSGGLRSTREAVAEDIAETGGPRLSWREVVLTAGGQSAVMAALHSVKKRTGRVLLIEPTWFSYEPLVRAVGARPVYARAEPPEYRLPEEEVKALVEAGVDAIVIPDPDNPTGRLLTPGEARLLVDLAVDHDAWLLVDEPYRTLIYEGSKVYPANLEPGHVIGLGALSKDPGIPGWRLGYAYGPEDAVKAIERFVEYTVYCPPRPAQELGEAYLRDERKWEFRRLFRLEYSRRRDTLLEALTKYLPEARVPKPPAGMFAYVDLSAYTGKARGVVEELAEYALREHGVAILPGEAFGPSQAGTARLTFTYETPERLREGVRRLAEALKDFKRARAT